MVSVLVIYFPGRGGGGTPRKNWVGVYDSLPKTLTLFMTKICSFSYPIYDLTKNLMSYLWLRCPKHNLWRVLVDDLIDNDEKVASSKKTYPAQDESNKHTLFMTKMAKIDTLFMTKTAEKPHPLGPHIPIQPIWGSIPRFIFDCHVTICFNKYFFNN